MGSSSTLPQMALPAALFKNAGPVVPISIRKLPRLCPDLDCSFLGPMCKVCDFDTGLEQREGDSSSPSPSKMVDAWVSETLLHVGSYSNDPSTSAPPEVRKPRIKRAMSHEIPHPNIQTPSHGDIQASLGVLALELQKCSARLARAAHLATWLSENCTFVDRYQQ